MQQDSKAQTNNELDQRLLTAKKNYMLFIVMFILIIAALFAFTYIFSAVIDILDSTTSLIFVIIVIVLTVSLIVFSGSNTGFGDRVNDYNRVKFLLPKCQIIRVKKNILFEYVEYQFWDGQRYRKLKMEYFGHNPYVRAHIKGMYYQLIMDYNYPFDLDAWIKPLGDEIFVTDNKNLLKYRDLINNFQFEERLQLNSSNRKITARTYRLLEFSEIILAMVEILFRSSERGRLIFTTEMPGLVTYIGGFKPYIACLNCNTILARWSLTKPNIFKCTSCTGDAVVLIGESDEHIKYKMAWIRNGKFY
jgi:hypothetical protein